MTKGLSLCHDAAAEGIVDDADVGSARILHFVCPNEFVPSRTPLDVASGPEASKSLSICLGT